MVPAPADATPARRHRHGCRPHTRPTAGVSRERTLAPGIRAVEHRAHGHRLRRRRRRRRPPRPRSCLARALPRRPRGQPTPSTAITSTPSTSSGWRPTGARRSGRPPGLHRRHGRRGRRAADARRQRPPTVSSTQLVVELFDGAMDDVGHHRRAAARRAARLLRVVDRPDGACTPTRPTRSPRTPRCRTGTGPARDPLTGVLTAPASLRSPGTSTACCLQHLQRHEGEPSSWVEASTTGAARRRRARGPSYGGHAPAIAGHEAREAVLGHRRAQVVADRALVLEESAVTTAQIVWLPRSSGPVEQQPSR